jgi:L-rhamnose isomerase
MNKPKTNRDEVRENSLTIPMSKQEKERVQKKANEMGISMSALGRVVLSDFFKKEERF